MATQTTATSGTPTRIISPKPNHTRRTHTLASTPDLRAQHITTIGNPVPRGGEICVLEKLLGVASQERPGIPRLV